VKSVKRLRTVIAVLLVAVVTVAALAGCGDGNPQRDAAPSHKSRAGTLDKLGLYSSLPMNTVQGQSIANGMMLVSGGARRVGGYTVEYHQLSDADQGSVWSEARTVETASSAATDPHAAFYVGELNRAANAVSAPILDEAGVPQLSPVDTGAPGTATAGLLNLQVSAQSHASTTAAALQQAGCTSVVVTSPSKQPALTVLRDQLAAQLRVRGVSVVANRLLPPFLASVTFGRGRDQAVQRLSTVSALNAQSADCAVIAGNTTTAVGELAQVMHSAARHIAVYGDVTSCTGVGSELAPSLGCVSPGIPFSSYAATAGFIHQYRSAFGPANAYALYGAQATELFFKTVQQLGSNAANRADVRDAMTSPENLTPVLEQYSFAARQRFSVVFYGLASAHGASTKRPSSAAVARTRLALYKPVTLSFTIVTALPASRLIMIRK
jgi:branched-chain amino acid transport system substrate-binding protein